MISLFRNNHLINSILLLPYILVLRIKSFFVAPYVPSASDSYLVKQIYGFLDSSTSQAIAGIVIIFLNALIINRSVIKHNLAKENNLIAGLIYALLSSIVYDFLTFSPIYFAIFFALLAIQKIFNSYNNDSSDDEIYLSGFYMCVATLFYFPLVFLFLFTFIGFIIIRSFTMVERVQHILGWLTPLFLVNSWQYFIKSYPTDAPAYFMNKLTINFFENGAKLADALTILAVLIITGLALLSYMTYVGKKVISSQKRISILYWYSLFVGIVSLLFKQISISHILLMMIPFSIFLMLNVLEIKNRVIPEIIHLLIVMGLAAIHINA